jgi:peptidoglycan/xylan/chitin deacetylase (PgdA/CDA1 family)
VRCLLYHRVGRVGDCEFLDRYGAAAIEPDSFARDLRFLREQGARFLTFADLRAGIFPGPDEFGVIVSFDDGTRDVYEFGLPIVESEGARAVVFQISGLVDSRTLIWEHLLYWLWQDPAHRAELVRQLRDIPGFEGLDGSDGNIDRIRYPPSVEDLERVLRKMSVNFVGKLAPIASSLYPGAEHLRAAAARGHEIGSHGRGHYPRPGLDDARFEEELQSSRADLEAVLTRDVHAFSHPFSLHRDGDLPVLAKHYRQAAVVEPRPIRADTNPLALPRLNWPGKFPNDLRWRRWIWTGE